MFRKQQQRGKETAVLGHVEWRGRTSRSEKKDIVGFKGLNVDEFTEQ